MGQPIRKGVFSNSVTSKKKKKPIGNKSITMRSKNRVLKKTVVENSISPQKTIVKVIDRKKQERKHAEYGTSKLEQRFAKNFLDKLGVKYIYQYKMASIGRYADFYLPESHVIIEVDGDYYHAYGLLYEQMSPMQKKNHRVDKEKDHWCLINGIPLIRIWEHDINDHPEKVMKILKERLYIAKNDKDKKDNMRKRH